MASVNKHALREEFDTLKARFEQLSTDGKLAAESRALFQAMLMLFEVLMVVFMEKRTAKDHRNSGLSSSQTAKDDDTATRRGSNTKGKAQNDALAGNTRTLETIQLAAVTECETCGEDLSERRCQGHERRTKIDIIFEKVVSHVDAEIKRCPRCQARTKGRFPADMPGPLQYGSGIKAYALHLLIAQMLSLKRVQHAIQTLIGQAIAEASILTIRDAVASRPGRLGTIRDGTDPGHARDACGRDLIAGRQKQSLDPCLFIWRHHPEIPASQARARGD